MAVNVVGDAYIVVHALTDKFKREVESALKDLNPVIDQAGRDVGERFSDNVSGGLNRTNGLFRSIAQQAERNRLAFNKLIRVGYFLGPALAGLAAALSDVVFGLFAVIAAVGSALPALTALGGAFVAVAQGAIVARVAFGGIGRAVQALTRQEGQATQNKRRLADAQRALNRALREGIEYIQQLGFDVEDAALAEQRAAMDLEAARQELFRMRDLPPDNRARREAELAFQEADLNYRRAVDRLADLKKEQDQVRGDVENLEPVIDARRNLEELKQDINRGGGGANSVANAMKDLSPEAQKFARFLASLKPVMLELRAAAGERLFGPMEKAIRNLLTMLPTFKNILRDTGGVIGQFALDFSKMLTSNEGRIQEIFGKTNIIVLRNLSAATTALGESFLIILDALQPLTIEFSQWVRLKSESLRDTLLLDEATGQLGQRFQKASIFIKAIGAALRATYEAFRELGRGAQVAGLLLIQSFTNSMRSLRDWARAGNQTGELQERFINIAKNVQSIGTFLANVAIALFNIAGNPGTREFFEGIERIPKIFEEMALELLKSGPEMSNFFTQFAMLMKNLTESGAVRIFFNILGEALAIVNRIFENELVQRVFVFLAALKAVTLAIGSIIAVVKFFGLAIVGTIMKAIHIVRTLNVVFSYLRFYVGGPVLAAIALIVGIFVLAYKHSEKFRESLSDFWQLIRDTVLVAFNEIKAVIEDVMKDFSGLGTGISDVFGGIGDFLARFIIPLFKVQFLMALNIIVGAIKGFIRIVGGIAQVFLAVWNVIAGVFYLITGNNEKAVERFRNAWIGLRNGLKNILQGLLEPFIGVLNGLVDVWNRFAKGNVIKIPEWIPGIGGRVIKLPELNRLGFTTPESSPRMSTTAAGHLADLRRNTSSTQAMIRGVAQSHLADLARTAMPSANKNDPWLIFRDVSNQNTTRTINAQNASINKLIQSLTGPGAGGFGGTGVGGFGGAGAAGTAGAAGAAAGMGAMGGPTVIINVYPSEGMDEREIASMVSRELALQLRRGGAGT